MPEFRLETERLILRDWREGQRLGMRRRPELDFRCPDFLPEKVTMVYSIDRDEWQRARPGP